LTGQMRTRVGDGRVRGMTCCTDGLPTGRAGSCRQGGPSVSEPCMHSKRQHRSHHGQRSLAAELQSGTITQPCCAVAASACTSQALCASVGSITPLHCCWACQGHGQHARSWHARHWYYHLQLKAPCCSFSDALRFCMVAPRLACYAIKSEALLPARTRKTSLLRAAQVLKQPHRRLVYDCLHTCGRPAASVFDDVHAPKPRTRVCSTLPAAGSGYTSWSRLASGVQAGAPSSRI
jgi:hypothetical protein